MLGTADWNALGAITREAGHRGHNPNERNATREKYEKARCGDA